MVWRWTVMAFLLAMSLVVAAPIEDPALLDLLRATPSAKDYPRDDAVWLLRDVDITVEPSGASVVRERKLITMLTEQGLALSQWQIPYDSATEQVEILTARTLLHERAFPVNPAQVVDSAVYPGIAWYDAFMVKRFPLPAAVVGATLEVETLFKRPTPRMPGDFSTRLHLQQSYPVREARFTIRVPAEKRLSIRFTGPFTPEVREREEKGRRVYSWSVQNVPALRIEEPQAPPVADLVASARVSWLAGWEPVAAWYRGLTDGKDTVTDAVRQVAEERTRGCRTEEEKIAALHKAVRELPYVAIEVGMLSDMPHTADEVLRQGYGDCKEKATLLRALLRAVDISSDYVLVRTTGRGALDRQCYSPGEFDHVILVTKTAQGDRFLDATLAEVPSDQLPPQVEGAEGLIIRGSGELITLPHSSAERNRTVIRVNTTVQQDGSAAGRTVLTFHGQTAVQQRAQFAGVSADRYREALEGTLAPRLGSEVSINAVEVTGLRDSERPLVITADFTSPAFLQAAGPQRSGYLPGFMYQPNAYRSTKTRVLPFLQTVESSLEVEAVITLPEGVTVAHLPEAVVYDGPAGSYRDAIATEGRTLRFTCQLATHRGLFPPDNLEAFRKWSSILALEGRNHLQFFLRTQ